MRLPLSTYYATPLAARAAREVRDADLRAEIETIRETHPRAGYRMLVGYLRERGVLVGERRVRRICAQFQLQIRPRKRVVHTTDSHHPHPVCPNLLADTPVTGLHQVWAADITYIRIANGFVFLAVILDLYSRKVIGWALSKRIDRELTLAALHMAIVRRNPPRGLIHHSDRGVQYLCTDYVAVLAQHGFRISCSRTGNPYDNAYVESFMKTLKHDEVHLWDYQTYLDVVERVPYFIEEVYNRKRLHSSLGYQSPETFEQRITMDYATPTMEVADQRLAKG